MSDMIDRQSVIDAKAELKGISKIWKRIKQLPSAQPEITRCKNCQWLGGLSGQYCEIHNRMVSNDSYCSWAERR